MSVRVTHDTTRFERDDEALAEMDALRPGWLEQQLVLARLFRRIDGRGAFVTAGSRSVQDLASRRGYDGRGARELCQLGYALEHEPDLEQMLRDNRIGFPAACALGRIYRDPRLQDEADEWLHWARIERLPDLRRRISQRVETLRQGRRADVPFMAHVTQHTSANIDRCRLVASRRAGVPLTNGQLLEVLSATYLLENDELEGGGGGSGTRRLPPTQERPEDRTIPAEVVRELRERSGGQCEFGDCESPAQEICHLVPHSEGGGREVTDLVEGCRLHHKALDGRLLRFLGWTRSDDPLGEGLPVFLATETNEFLRPKPRPIPGLAIGALGNRSPWLLRALGPRLRKRLKRQWELHGGYRHEEAPTPDPESESDGSDCRSPPTAGGP